MAFGEAGDTHPKAFEDAVFIDRLTRVLGAGGSKPAPATVWNSQNAMDRQRKSLIYNDQNFDQKPNRMRSHIGIV